MIILKRPECVVFNTEAPDNMIFDVPKALTMPLNEKTGESDWAFLERHFQAKGSVQHPIFRNFHHSYYYAVEVSQPSLF